MRHDSRSPHRSGGEWRLVTVARGQTLTSIFAAHGFHASDLARVLANTADKAPLENLHPGTRFWLKAGRDGRLEGIRYLQGRSGTPVTLRLTRMAAGTSPQLRASSTGRHVAWGQIQTSLFKSATEKKVPPFLVSHLAGMFKQAVDFRDLRTGSYFAVIYGDSGKRASATGPDDILAAEIHTPRRSVAAYRFQAPARPVAYYTAEGVPLQHPTLLRYPTSFTYLSSPFGMRVDPAIHRYQLHQGIDLAAPVGTPVRAAGDGVITYRGWMHGYGEYITVRNSASFTTGYAHLSRFAAGQRVGTRVRQGEVIGYVGNTGWSTGPHLEFETFVDGRPVDPLKVAGPAAEPLAGAVLAEFKRETAQLVARVHAINERIEKGRAAGAPT